MKFRYLVVAVVCGALGLTAAFLCQQFKIYTFNPQTDMVNAMVRNNNDARNLTKSAPQEAAQFIPVSNSAFPVSLEFTNGQKRTNSEQQVVPTTTDQSFSRKVGLATNTFLQPPQSISLPLRTGPSRPHSSLGTPKNHAVNQFTPDTKPTYSHEYGNWLIGLKNTELVSCDLLNLTSLKIQTRHGQVNVKLDEVICCQWVKPEQLGPKSSVVVFSKTCKPIVVITSSGDVFSGACEIDTPKIRVLWGDATISLDQIEFISNLKLGAYEIAAMNEIEQIHWTLQRLERHQIQFRWQPQSRSATTSSVRQDAQATSIAE